jgi:hypothetical protein
LTSNIDQIYERRKRSNELKEERVASKKKDKIKIDKKGKKRKKKYKKERRIEGEMNKMENSTPTSRLQVSDMYLKIIRLYAT